MNRLALFALVAGLAATPAWAHLDAGAKAPMFTTQASLGGKEFTFSLAEALRKGPVVLYFYPAAFTKGCTIEAHEFAAAVDQFKSLGATVVGVSHDPIETLNRFSLSECQSKFPVAADPDQQIMKAYDAVLSSNPNRANRTSYAIAPDGKILVSYTELEPDHHVDITMAAVKTWRNAHPLTQ